MTTSFKKHKEDSWAHMDVYSTVASAHSTVKQRERWCAYMGKLLVLAKLHLFSAKRGKGTEGRTGYAKA